MGFATTIVTPELLGVLRAREDVTILQDVPWCSRDPLRYLAFTHHDAPDGRHVDVILDEEGLRFKIDVPPY